MAKLTPISCPTPLTPAQATLLRAAALREDGAIALPARLKGKAAFGVGGSLIAKGLAREVRAKPGLPTWRQDPETGKSNALVITKAGRIATSVPDTEVERAAVDQGAGRLQPVQVGDVRQQSETEISQTGSGQGAPQGSTRTLDDLSRPSRSLGVSAPRPQSKLATVIGLLERETGVTIDDLIAATGWLPHTTRAALTGLRKRGYALTTKRQHGAGATYRIQPAPAFQAA